MIPKPTLHSLAQKFRARARNAKKLAQDYFRLSQLAKGERAYAKTETLEECASEVERLKQ